MKRQLVFIPIAADELGVLLGDPAVEDRPAYTVTPELLEELGYTEAESEDAEYAALLSPITDNGKTLNDAAKAIRLSAGYDARV